VVSPLEQEVLKAVIMLHSLHVSLGGRQNQTSARRLRKTAQINHVFVPVMSMAEVQAFPRQTFGHLEGSLTRWHTQAK
jgi:hypothetical protein